MTPVTPKTITPFRAALPGLIMAGLLVACSPSSKATQPQIPYAEQVLRDHGVDYRTCFVRPTLADTAAPSVAAGQAGGVQDALVAIDSSGSMAARIAGQSKMDAAREAVNAFVQALPAESRVGLLVFGHEGANTAAAKAASCSAGARVLVAPTGEHAQVATALAGLKPAGWTPLAAAIRSASQAMAGGPPGAKVLYVVSDGLETCGEDPVAEARAANKGGQKIVVNVIAFGVPTAEQARLREVASAGGGSFMVAQDPQSLRDALRQAQESSVRGYFQSTAATRGQNVMAVGAAVSRATQCVRTSVDTERVAALAAIAADEKAGRADAAAASSARSLVYDRGTKALGALVAYAEALRTAEGAQAAAMWRRFDETQAQLASQSTYRTPTSP